MRYLAIGQKRGFGNNKKKIKKLGFKNMVLWLKPRTWFSTKFPQFLHESITKKIRILLN